MDYNNHARPRSITQGSADNVLGVAQFLALTDLAPTPMFSSLYLSAVNDDFANGVSAMHCWMFLEF